MTFLFRQLGGRNACVAVRLTPPRCSFPYHMRTVNLGLPDRFDHGSNPARYSKGQAYLRKHQPATLIVWDKTIPSFLPKEPIRISEI